MRARIRDYELIELVAHILGVEYTGENDDEIVDTFEEKMGMAFEDFKTAAETLILYTPIIKSELSGILYHSFGVDGMALVKVEAKEGEK